MERRKRRNKRENHIMHMDRWGEKKERKSYHSMYKWEKDKRIFACTTYMHTNTHTHTHTHTHTRLCGVQIESNTLDIFINIS